MNKTKSNKILKVIVYKTLLQLKNTGISKI